VWQLVDGLAPIMGWGARPTEPAQLARWHRAHAQNVRRWLADLQAGGLISYEGERDNRGQHWRTLITLLDAPPVPDDELAIARERMKTWTRRRRAARRPRRDVPRRGRRLEGVRRSAQPPGPELRRRRAVQRARTIAAHRRARKQQELRTQHFVAPLPGEHVTTNPEVNASAWWTRTGVTRAHVSGHAKQRAAISDPETASLTDEGSTLPFAVVEAGRAERFARFEALRQARAPVIDMIRGADVPAGR
jgi:hypothetical protein